VEFAINYLSYFTNGMILAAPLVGLMVLIIIALGLIAGALESWRPFDAIYWAFITATTVGYGDIRPIKSSSRLLSILIALQGMVFTGIIVALAINAATIAFSELHEGASLETAIEEMDRPSSKQLPE
jgi:voltage-gated potassium channel